MEPLQCCSVASHCSKEQRHNIPTFFLEKYVQCDVSTEFLMITSIWLFLGSSLSSLLVTLLMMESNWWKLNVATNSWKNLRYSLLRRKSIAFHYILMLTIVVSIKKYAASTTRVSLMIIAHLTLQNWIPLTELPRESRGGDQSATHITLGITSSNS